MDKIFIDSNIWIYAFIATDDLTKHEICVSLLEVLSQERIMEQKYLEELRSNFKKRTKKLVRKLENEPFQSIMLI